METPPSPSQEQAEQVLEGLRTHLRPADDGGAFPRQDDPPTILPIRHFVTEMESRWTLAGIPERSTLPVVGPILARVQTTLHRAVRWYLWPILQWPILQQQIDFNGATVRFAQRVNRDLTTLSGITEVVGVDEGKRDRFAVDVQREIGVLRVLTRHQHRRLEEMEGQLVDALEEVRALRRRLDHDARPAPAAGAVASGTAAGVPAPSRLEVDYYRFELKFRGSSDTVREHQRQYVHHFAGASDVLDIGCGRGEFMELLVEQGVSCRGVDLDGDMVAACREKGLEVAEQDALAYLRDLPDASLGGAFTGQLVEHLDPAVMVDLLHLLGRKLRPGAAVVIETINPQCLLAASSHFLVDLSHVRLVHPETLRFLLEGDGFSPIDLHYTSPVPDEVQLQGMVRSGDGSDVDGVRGTHNHNMEKLNAFLFGYQDYAVVARKRTED